MLKRKMYQAILCLAVAVVAQLACRFPTTQQSTPQPTPTAQPTPTQTAAPTPTPPEPPFLIGYFYGIDKNNLVAAIPGSLLTDLIYAFLYISPEGRCVSSDPVQDQANFAALTALKEQYPHLRVHFSIGGGGSSSGFSEAAASEASRRAFAQSCVEILQQNGFDGIDLDWEFPGRSGRTEDRANYPALLAEFRAQLDTLGRMDGRAYFLSIAAPAGENESAHYDLGKIEPLVDWINIMTYGYYDERSPTTNLNTALYLVETGPSGKSYSADSVVRAYLAGEIPGRKIMVGAAFSGLGWKGVPGAQDGLYQPANGPFDDPNVPPGTWNEEGKIRYRSIEAYYLNAPGWNRYWQAEAQAPWLYNAEAGAFITYDDEQSLAAKADYVMANQLGGVMIWQIGADGKDYPLLKALAARLLP